ncbi:DMT family transporter [Prosthecomicrobium sp. N25]|uniref:DMT family transporter n=1 Tax=Prosthecomicrobium sp. N25 TaxID=3129254 RepID=UPI003077EA6E
MPAQSDNARGILAMNVAMFAFVVNDSFVKAVSATLPLGEIMLLRGLVATAGLLLLCRLTGAFAAWRALRDRMLVFRLVGEIGATFFFVAGLTRLPIGNVSAIFQVTPLAATAAAALFLGERVGWRRWTAILVGFLGVLVIIRPGLTGFDHSALLILASVGFVVLRDLATSRMPAAIPTFLAALSSSVTIMLFGLCLYPVDGAISLVGEWRPPRAGEMAMLTGAGAGLLAGYVLLTIAMRTGEMGVVAPFRYALLLWAFLIGVIFFGERPDGFTLLGAAIVVATGLYTVQRERRRARSADREAPAPVRAG